MEFHPVANIFPLLQGQEFEDLKADIAQNGLIQPIWVHPDGRIIDGRNRWRACVETGTNADFEVWDEAKHGPLVQFVISLNLHRRHLDSSQRAAIAVEVLPMLEEEARERQQQSGGDKKSDDYQKSVSQKIDEPILGNGNNGKAAQQAADLFHTNRQYVSEAKALKEKAPELFSEVKSGNMTIVQARREFQKQTRPEVPPPTGKYRVIYADPPWKYGNTMPDYFTEQADHYPPMALADIASLPIREIAEDNAVLFVWVTSPILEESFQVIKAWGFQYKASFVWDKVKHNMGHYNSVRHEFLLVCVRGSCQPDVPKLFDSVQSIERTEHSKKPEEFRQIIDTLYPQGGRIELFARQSVANWEVYGNEL